MRHLGGHTVARTGLLGLAAACAAALLAGPAAPRSDDTVLRVGWRITAVEALPDPGIREIRVAGSGTLEADQSPLIGGRFTSPSQTRAGGGIVVEYDLTEPDREVRIILQVTDGTFTAKADDAFAASLVLEVVKTVNAFGTRFECPRSAGGTIGIASTKTQDIYTLNLPKCGINNQTQKARIGRNSKVKVSFDPKCLRSAQARKPLCASAGTTFTLGPGLTKVENFDPTRLKINAQTAHRECCPGGATQTWDYNWKVPSTLVTGKTATLAVGLSVSIVPSQLADGQIRVVAPDFVKDLQVNFPAKPSASATYKVPIAKSLASAKELFVQIRFEYGVVTYYYRK
jgi:hypothetical protein